MGAGTVTSAVVGLSTTGPGTSFVGMPAWEAGVPPWTSFGASGAPNYGLSTSPRLLGATIIAGQPGSAANGAFGVGTFTGTGDIVGGTQPSAVTGTTGAGVLTGLDTFGIGNGFGSGWGIHKTPDGAAPLY